MQGFFLPLPEYLLLRISSYIWRLKKYTMQKILLSICLLLAANVFAQTKTLNQAIITTKTTISSPEGEEDTPPPPPPGGADGAEVRTMRFGGDGETKTTTYFKNGMIKTVMNTEMGNTITIRDIKNKKTTTLMEMMGNKTGFYTTDEEQEAMRKRMDSMMQSRQGDQAPMPPSTPATYEISYREDTKKIAGVQCKKAIIYSNRNNKKDSATVWYNPEFKIDGLSYTGGSMGGPMGGGFRGNGPGGFSQLAGFPMAYEMNMRRGRKMVVEVTKIDIIKEIDDKEFDIPKGYEIKPMKDMQTGEGGRGFMFRMQH